MAMSFKVHGEKKQLLLVYKKSVQLVETGRKAHHAMQVKINTFPIMIDVQDLLLKLGIALPAIFAAVLVK